MGYYLVRNNITLSTPFIQNQLDLSKSDIGTITGSMLITYGISKGAMSVISDKADPKKIYGFRSYFMCSCKCFTWFFKFFLRLCRFCYLAWVFQGMGVDPSFITLANWYPKKRAGNLYSYLEYLAQFRRRYNRSYSVAFWICFSSIFRRKLGRF
ncbi:MFS transporter [Campylobacter coli]|uniref:MFS transporter n=1 Tax=Campylobacter coli TaxID=195 RepID=UPI003CF2EF1E